jgi:hypothetical protein
MLELETYDENDRQFIITDHQGLEWSTHYGVEGSGFGYCEFFLPRKVDHEYDDIGSGYRVKLRKYLNLILFDGQMRHIEEISGPDGDQIKITCLGQVVVAGDDEILRAFCDTRLDMWHMESEIPKGSFRPERFGTGSGAFGLYIHANNNAMASAGDYTELAYNFFPGEVAERIKCDLSTHLGAGVVFDATVSSVSGADLIYANDSGEGQLAADMLIYNAAQGKYATIQSVNTGTNTITVTNSGDILGWASPDELAVYGPLFAAQIDSISTDTITYSGDIIAESNLAAGQALANISKKSVATIDSVDTGANTITVTNEDHIDGWEVNDVIVVGAPYFSCTLSSIASATITYSSPIGERVASAATGWVLHNTVEPGDTAYATVDSWNIAANQLDVTDPADISTWSATDPLRIYTPYRVDIRDSADNVIWPDTDEREGAIPRNRTAVDELTTGSPAGFKIRYTCYIAGTGTEASFVNLDDLRVYSTEDDATAETLAKYIVSVLSAAGHDLSSSEDEIEAIAKIVEPMVFEFQTPAEALTSICQFGDGSGNLLAWGIRLNEDKELFVEAQDSQTIEYVIKRDTAEPASVSGDVQESIQQVRAIYTDKMGEQQVTDWIADTGYYFAGHFRRKSVRMENIDNDTEAQALAQIYLDENKAARRTTKFPVSEGSIFSPEGIPIPFDEIRATGGYAQVENWHGVESSGLRHGPLDTPITEKIIAVEIDYESGKVLLTPAGATSDFERYLAELARMAQK